jgi:ParB-like nuclease domain.
MNNLKDATLALQCLLLDPNNFRFQDAEDFVYADPKRFADSTVQSKAAERLRSESLLPLKNSILKNGFLPFERIVVTPYSGGKYLVVDGNRRLAALRWIESDQNAGAAVSDAVLETLKAVPVVIVPNDDRDPALREALMGIRHVSGIKQWGGYQRAQLVATLKDKYKLESTEIAQRLGMSSNEVNRRYRAFQALRQMMEHDEFGDAARSTMYPIFHEAVSLPAVRDWLGWSEESSKFTKTDELTQFYGLISPGQSNEESEPSEAKIVSYSQIRELRAILDNNEARKILLDPSRTFVEAVAISKREEMANSWKAEIVEAVNALKSLGVLELKRATQDDIGLLGHLRDLANELLIDVGKLTKQ